MPNLFACPPGADLAREAARWLLAEQSSEALARAVIFVPTRRAAIALRRGFTEVLDGNAVLLPRMVPITAISDALPALLGPEAFTLLQSISPAMTDYEQRYLLTQQVAAFEARRNPGGAARLDQSLALAEELMQLQDECARHEVPLTPEKLAALSYGNFAAHWEASLQFLRILADSWPAIESALGQTTSSHRETKLLRALANHWRDAPPDFPVYAMGSTASHPATAALLAVIAQLPHGAVFLPGLDMHNEREEWAEVAPGHPLHHLKQFLLQLGCNLSEVKPLTTGTRVLWQEALLPTALLPQWKQRSLPDYRSIKLVPCQHGEEEARAIALLMREGLDTAGRTALITPDEGLMARVAAQLTLFGLVADRLRAGILADTQAGNLWTQLVRAIVEPERLLHLHQLLHHPRSNFTREYLAQLQPYLHRRAPRKPGRLPYLPEALQLHEETAQVENLARSITKLASKTLPANEWITQLQPLLASFVEDQGEGIELVDEALDALASANLPPMGIAEFDALLAERLTAPWRDASVQPHPRLSMLTPVEARLEHFDRVILGGMVEQLWPGTAQSGAWLNLASRAAIGLPAPEEEISLMAHDVLVHGSAPKLFLTWPARAEGSPTTRSRFIERFVTLLATHGISEAEVTDTRIAPWLRTQFMAEDFSPAAPARPVPTTAQRPTRLPVSRLDSLFSDPYHIYAEFVLGLRKLDAMDAEPEPRDFGTITHAAILALTEHWNTQGTSADEAMLNDIAARTLRGYDDEPAIALFWQTRLLNALRFVNEEEKKRRASGEQVQGEVKVESSLNLPNNASMTLYGRIDRSAPDAIGDYKTGAIPTEKDILGGEALQLLAYAMLCEAAGHKSSAIEYWQLPHARRKGLVQRTEFVKLEEAGLPEGLRNALATMLNEQTPFLAKPGGDTRDDDYDGISRYDEWAG